MFGWPEEGEATFTGNWGAVALTWGLTLVQEFVDYLIIVCGL